MPDALGKFQAASQAAPKASSPLAAAANLYFYVAQAGKPENATRLRTQAESMVRAALNLSSSDPLAQEVLRRLRDAGSGASLHWPDAAAEKRQLAAGTPFQQHQFAQALAKYQEVMQLDPQYSGAWVGAGDCWYMQKEWSKAEALFRRAAEIEPRNGQAWRFLSVALAEQGRRAEV